MYQKKNRFRIYRQVIGMKGSNRLFYLIKGISLTDFVCVKLRCASKDLD